MTDLATERQGLSAAELARQAMANVDRGDLDGLQAAWHPEVELYWVATGKRLDAAGSRAEFAEIFAAFPDFHITPTRVLEQGDTAIIEWEAAGTHTGAAYQGIMPTGKRVELRGVDLMEFSGGLLRRNTIYYDGLSVARGLGLLPPDGSVGDRALKALFNLGTRLRRLVRARPNR